MALVAFVVALFAGPTVAVLIVVMVLVDIAIQTLNILNQTRVFAISQEARSRINTAFVTSNFIGGAIGSAAATILWSITAGQLWLPRRSHSASSGSASGPSDAADGLAVVTPTNAAKPPS